MEDKRKASRMSFEAADGHSDFLRNSTAAYLCSWPPPHPLHSHAACYFHVGRCPAYKSVRWRGGWGGQGKHQGQSSYHCSQQIRPPHTLALSCISTTGGSHSFLKPTLGERLAMDRSICGEVPCGNSHKRLFCLAQFSFVSERLTHV